MSQTTPLHPLAKQRGFTVIELMVTVTIAAILAALAIPSLRAFIVRNTFSSIGNDFTGSLLRARNEAIGKNMCVTMCLSTTVDTTSGNGPVCATTGQDWQTGWIVFLNPECDTTLNRPREKDTTGTLVDKPQNMILVRRQGNNDYYLMLQGSSPSTKIQFNSRGNTTLNSAGEFDLAYLSSNGPLTLSYAFNICLDKMGRTRTIPATSNCSY